MKKIVYWLTITVSILCLATGNGYSQDGCHLENGACKGDCGTWYFAVTQPGQQPRVAGYPDCIKVKIGEGHGKPIFACHCRLIFTTLGCRDDACDDGGCPLVYASIAEAISGDNPITGFCVPQKTGNLNNCACNYEK